MACIPVHYDIHYWHTWGYIDFECLTVCCCVLNLYCCGPHLQRFVGFPPWSAHTGAEKTLEFLFNQPLWCSCSDFPLHSVKVKKIYKCEQCNYKSGRKVRLKWHIETHAANRNRVLNGRSAKPLHCDLMNHSCLDFLLESVKNKGGWWRGVEKRQADTCFVETALSTDPLL